MGKKKRRSGGSEEWTRLVLAVVLTAVVSAQLRVLPGFPHQSNSLSAAEVSLPAVESKAVTSHKAAGAKAFGGAASDAAERLQARLGNRRVVVSLSTFPGRVELVPPTVFSLTTQSLRPTVIYLWVALDVHRVNVSAGGSDSDGAKLPDSVTELMERFPGLVKASVTEDFGPASKLLPTLLVERDPNTIIVTVDDDTYYHANTLQDLVEELLDDPTHAMARSCEETYVEEGERKFKWRLDKGECHGFATAYAGAAYLRSMFPNDRVFNYSPAPKACWYHDDVWLSGHLWLNGYRPYIIEPFVHEWSVMYHRPWNELSIQNAPESGRKKEICVAFFKHFMDEDKKAVAALFEGEGRQGDGQADAQTDAQTDAQADAKADAQTDAKSDAKEDTQADAQADAKEDAHAAGHGQGDAHADAQADAKAVAKAAEHTAEQGGAQAAEQKEEQATMLVGEQTAEQEAKEAGTQTEVHTHSQTDTQTAEQAAEAAEAGSTEN